MIFETKIEHPPGVNNLKKIEFKLGPKMRKFLWFSLVVTIVYFFPPYSHYEFMETKEGLIRCNKVTGRVDRPVPGWPEKRWERLAEG